LITYKFQFNSDETFYPLLKEGNKIVRIAFNLFKKGYDLKQVEKTIKTEYTYDSDLIDATMLKFFCQDADNILKSCVERGQDKLIFGSKHSWKEFNQGKISKDELFTIRNTRPLSFYGDSNSRFGNRKFELDIDNSQFIFKPNRKTHYKLNINSGRRYNDLLKIQIISEQRLMPISYRLSDKHIYITFDESFLKTETHIFKKDRVASLDLNPNYIGFTILDNGQDIVYKEVIDLVDLNKTHDSNKKDYEVIHIAKKLSKLCKHYQVEFVGLEDLNMVSKNHGKGRMLNRLLNNTWNRNLFSNNFIKRLNILGIKNHKIAAAYSSTIGCLQYPEETDSIAAALEIGRRAYVYKKRYLDKDKNFLNEGVIYPILDYKKVKERWNSILQEYNPPRVGWKSIHNHLKQQKKLNQLRFLFKDYNFSNWSCLRYQSRKSMVYSYFSI